MNLSKQGARRKNFKPSELNAHVSDRGERRRRSSPPPRLAHAQLQLDLLLLHALLCLPVPLPALLRGREFVCGREADGRERRVVRVVTMRRRLRRRAEARARVEDERGLGGAGGEVVVVLCEAVVDGVDDRGRDEALREDASVEIREYMSRDASVSVKGARGLEGKQSMCREWKEWRERRTVICGILS